ncbi:NAD-dependent epimerase/dehydratase family protein [Candidatus Latescibacterota bacterium]
MFKNAKALVTGGTGLIGANLILKLLSLGCTVRATIHKNPPVIEDDSIEYIQADLTNMDDCKRATEDMDFVFMCAANTSGAAVMATTPLAHVTPNVVMNAQIMEAAYLAKVKKFLFISSSAAYPPSGARPVREEEMFNGDPEEIYYSVGWMKKYAEILCIIYSQKIKNPMPCVVIRPSNSYGPYDKYDFGKSHMCAAMLRRVVERHDPIEVWGTGDDVRDLIYIDDLIDGIILSMEKTDLYKAVNIASGKGHTVKEVLQTFIEVDGYSDATVTFDPSKPTMIPIRLVDTSKAEKELGFTAKTSLREGFEKTVRWYREHMLK